MPADRPTTLLAELTHRCPLHCPYCSNPLELIRAEAELATDDWKRVFTQARELGVLQLGLSGGEPLSRKDLEELAAHARGGLYTTLVTSGPRPHSRPRRAAAGGRARAHPDLDPGRRSRGRGADRRRAARSSRSRPRRRSCGSWASPSRSTSCSTGPTSTASARSSTWPPSSAPTGSSWPTPSTTGGGSQNRAALMPTREQVERSRADRANEAIQRYRGRMQITTSCPTTSSSTPRPATAGGASSISSWRPTAWCFPATAPPRSPRSPSTTCATTRWSGSGRSRRRSRPSGATSWMKEPCRSCPRKTVDFGGCRCQAFALTGDAANTDPVCTLTPDCAA